MTKRYTYTVDTQNDFIIAESENGEYVLHSDYAKVLSQRDRLVALICSMLPIEFDEETGLMKLKKEEAKSEEQKA